MALSWYLAFDLISLYYLIWFDVLLTKLVVFNVRLLQYFFVAFWFDVLLSKLDFWRPIVILLYLVWCCS